MSMMLAEDIDLAPGRRSSGGILANANPLPSGWENGVAFRTIGCVEPEILTPCVVSDPPTDARPDSAVFEPIFIRQNAACSTLTPIGSVDRAAARLESTTEWALGRSLSEGAGSTNPQLDEAVVVHAINTPAGDLTAQMIDLISCLEQGVADVGFGAEAFLHAPPRAAAYLHASDLVDDEGRSPSGHTWIFSSGYRPAPGNVLWINATGSVWAAVTDSYSLNDGMTGRPSVGWQINLDSAYQQRLGLAVFDPCINLRATMVVPACLGGP